MRQCSLRSWARWRLGRKGRERSSQRDRGRCGHRPMAARQGPAPALPPPRPPGQNAGGWVATSGSGRQRQPSPAAGAAARAGAGGIGRARPDQAELAAARSPYRGAPQPRRTRRGEERGRGEAGRGGRAGRMASRARLRARRTARAARHSRAAPLTMARYTCPVPWQAAAARTAPRQGGAPAQRGRKRARARPPPAQCAPLLPLTGTRPWTAAL
jgi:hypothetical protein